MVNEARLPINDTLDVISYVTHRRKHVTPDVDRTARNTVQYNFTNIARNEKVMSFHKTFAWSRSSIASSLSRRRASISSNSIWRVGSGTGASGGVGSCVADVEATGVGVSRSGVRTSGRGDSGDSGDSSSSSGSSLRFVRFAAGRTTFCKHRFLRLSYLKMSCCLHHPDSIGINSCI